jgi:Iron-sulfur cluster-binding domain
MVTISQLAAKVTRLFAGTHALLGFDPELLSVIGRVGFHPFILVRRSDVQDPAHRFIVCKTQNEAPQFVNDLAALPRFARSKLLRGVERALQLETYDAADLLFSWTKSQADGLTETIYVGKPPAVELPTFHGYPAFEFTAAEGADSSNDRVEMLFNAFQAYKTTTGNDALRFAVMEAIAFGLSRALGTRRQYDRARLIADDMLAITPGSIHLKAVKYALTLKIAGKVVPPRLEKYVGEDNGYLRQFVCSQPFERFDIGPDGNVMVCCGHWLPTSIGNFMREPVDNVLNSPRAQQIRQSMVDGTYKYCNHLECGAMAQESLPKRDDIPHAQTRKSVASNDFRIDGVDQIMFAFDQTCNLSCPSCRTHVITEKVSQSVEKARAVEEKLLPMLPSLRVLNINPAGELFGSKPSRRLLELINDERCPELRLDIISNGTLFSEEEWNKFPGIHSKVRSIRISTDAASKETFEKLRRLGKYDVFCRNMRFLRDLRRSGVIPQLKFSFTYQLDNFREMEAFVEFCDEMAADYAIFERLQNIAFSAEEFRQRAVHYTDHPLYAEFIEIIKAPVFRTKRVWHDFDYDGVEKMSGEEARERLSEALVAAG